MQTLTEKLTEMGQLALEVHTPVFDTDGETVLRWDVSGGRPDSEVMDLLNTPDPELPKKKVAVPTSSALAVFLASGKWGLVKAMSQTSNPTSPQLQAVCITVVDAILHLQSLGTDDPRYYDVISGALEGLVGAGIVDEPTRTALMALADAPQSWADINLGRPVTAREIGEARLAARG